MRRLLPDPGTAGRRRPGGGLPAAAGPVAAGELRRLAGRRDHRRRPQRGAGVAGRPADLHRAAGARRRRARRARDRGGGGLRADHRRLPASAGCATSLGRPATAPIAVVSRRASLDPGSALVTAADSPTILVTCAAADAGRRAALADAGVTVLVCGDDDVDLPAALDALAESRARAGALRGRAAAAARRADRRGGRRAGPVDRARTRRRRGAAARFGAARRSSGSSSVQLLEEDGMLFARYAVRLHR